MRKLALTVSALALSLAIPATAIAQGQGQGRGNGHGAQDHSDHGNSGRGGGRDDDRGRGSDRDDRGRGQDRDQGPARVQPQADVRDAVRGPERDRGQPDRAPIAVVRDRGDDRDFRDTLREIERRDDSERREAVREFERRLDDRDIRVVSVPDGRDYFMLVRDRDYRVIDGCPPGLAWRNNGCLPPGQARRLERAARYDWVWDRRDDDYRYRYADGYVYRTNASGGLSGWLPVLAGALGLNNVWPQQYAYEPVPQYYSSYYGLGDRYDYRYADGVVYALDPQTQRIQQVSALLTGQPWTVGQAMPKGYDVYNVPYQYRTQYRDTPDTWYRYNDGYVYQVDPTTQLVQAVIQLLT